MKLKISAIVLMTIWVSGGCIFDSDSRESEPLEGLTYNFDIALAKIGTAGSSAEPSFKVIPAWGGSTSTYTMTLRTDTTYGYGGRIDIRVWMPLRTILVEIRGVYMIKPDELTMPVTSPATAYSELKLADGDYHLKIYQLGITDRYEMHVSNGEVEIETVEAKFTEPFLSWPL